jgi:transcriptional regulator with XRE-family HTH domain
MTLGERILVLRRRLKWSQSTLARAVDLNKNTIARLERGEIVDVSGANIVQLAKALRVSTDVLLGVVDMDEESEQVPLGLALVGTSLQAEG